VSWLARARIHAPGIEFVCGVRKILAARGLIDNRLNANKHIGRRNYDGAASDLG
jgi:hypothetical protein